MKVSVIIPVVNENENLKEAIPIIFNCANEDLIEIIVVDGGSSDESQEMAGSLGARVIQSPLKSRSVQMNLGAAYAKGDILYFIHG